MAQRNFDVPVEEANRFRGDRAPVRVKVTTFIRAVRLLAELDAHQRDGGEVLLRSADGKTTERLRLL